MKGLCQPCGSVWWGLVRPILDSQDYHVPLLGKGRRTERNNSCDCMDRRYMCVCKES